MNPQDPHRSPTQPQDVDGVLVVSAWRRPIDGGFFARVFTSASTESGPGSEVVTTRAGLHEALDRWLAQFDA